MAFTTPSKEKFVEETDSQLNWSSVSNETYVPNFGSPPSFLSATPEHQGTNGRKKEYKSAKELLLEAEIVKLRLQLQQAMNKDDNKSTILIPETILSIDPPPLTGISIDNNRADTPFFSPVTEKHPQKSSIGENERNQFISLMDACRNADIESIRTILLVERRLVNMREVDSCGLSPLHSACGRDSAGDTSVLNLLVHNFQADVHVVDDFGGSPLHYACASGHTEIVRTLIADMKLDVEVTDQEGKTPLMYAAYNGRTEVARCLVHEFEARTNYCNPCKWTALHCAVLKGHYDMAELLVEDCAAEVNVENYVRKTPLHYAAELGHADIAAVLLKHNADASLLDVTNSGPLHYACHKGHLSVAELLLAPSPSSPPQGNPIDCNVINKFNIFPLFYACGHRSLKLVQMVMQDGKTDVDAVNVDGFTALQHACIIGDSAIVQYLLDMGADMNYPNKDGYTAFSHALYNGRMAALFLLFKRSVFKPTRSMLVLFYIFLAVVVCGIAMVWTKY